MNIERLNEILDCYVAQYDRLIAQPHNERFKWEAVKCFQDEWNGAHNAGLSFSQMFKKALAQSSVLIDNSTVAPSNGILKMAQMEEETVKRLFNEVLFADDGGDLSLRQDHMELFLDEIEQIRQRYFPGFWKYKQDRHSAACYLALFAPEENYIYKYAPAETFARYVEFGKDLGSGNSFSLSNYYEMCDMIVQALRGRSEFLEHHFNGLDEKHYVDNSLHILAFDVICCAASYGFYTGDFKPKAEILKQYRLAQKRKEEEDARLALERETELRLMELRAQIEPYQAISLLGVQVSQKQSGVGTVIAQNANMITVQYGQERKNYIIHENYPLRPTFEDDMEIVAAMTAYDALLKEQKNLEGQLRKLSC